MPDITLDAAVWLACITFLVVFAVHAYRDPSYQWRNALEPLQFGTLDED